MNLSCYYLEIHYGLCFQGWIGGQSSSVCDVPITVNVWGDRSSEPKDIVDGILLKLKETADICSLDVLVEVMPTNCYN